ncbi:MAG TPA: hypothetical protein VFQ51_12310 [Vicinamibacteria bacterium]|nr:hypothetical protein [Vicinamibacteria bacterium]
MKRLLLLSLVLTMAGVAPALADHPGAATMEDLRQLQAEVDRLDDSLAQLGTGSPRAEDFQRREDEIRDELVWLRGQVRRHQRDESQGLGASKAEVEQIRQSIVDLRNDVDRSLGTRSRRSGTGEISVPNGTEMSVRLDTPLSSKTARREDRVEATVAESVRVDGDVQIPAGTRVRGIVQDAQPAERPSKGGRLDLEFDQLLMPNGRRVDIRSTVASVSESGIDKKRAGLGAILGGILGGVLEGKKGALIGVLVGGGGAVVASKGDDVELPAGTVVNLRLERPVAVR